MDDGFVILLVSAVAIFSVMAWHKEFMLIQNGWVQYNGPNPVTQVTTLLGNLGRLLKNSMGLLGDILVTSWASGIGGASSTLALFVGLLISDIVSIYVCTFLYKCTPWEAIKGIIVGFPKHSIERVSP